MNHIEAFCGCLTLSVLILAYFYKSVCEHFADAGQ